MRGADGKAPKKSRGLSFTQLERSVKAYRQTSSCTTWPPEHRMNSRGCPTTRRFTDAGLTEEEKISRQPTRTALEDYTRA